MMTQCIRDLDTINGSIAESQMNKQAINFIVLAVSLLGLAACSPVQPSRPESTKAADSRQTSNTSRLPPLPPFATPLAEALAKTNPVAAMRLALWQAPIEFYGKVVDENSNAVAGVNIHFSWYDIPAKDGERTADTQSDSEGLFSLQGKHGPSLTVGFSKEGYYSSQRGEMSFNYVMGTDIISPDPQNPVVFNLRKKGTSEPLVHIAGIGLRTMRDYLLAADGKPTEVSLRDGRLAPVGQGDLKVEFRAGDSIAPSEISWWCQVSVPGGGLMETSEEFPFLAPENGYQEFNKWSITSTNWTETLDKQYYVKLRDGNFGQVKLRVIGVPKRAYFRMESFLNPSGSRNLEPAN